MPYRIQSQSTANSPAYSKLQISASSEDQTKRVDKSTQTPENIAAEMQNPSYTATQAVSSRSMDRPPPTYPARDYRGPNDPKDHGRAMREQIMRDLQ